MSRLPRILTAAVGVAGIVAATAGCSPSQMVQYLIGNGQGYQAEAKQGPDDGGGPLFAVAVVCSGEGFWRQAPWTNVEGAATVGGTSVFPGEAHWHSTIWCPPGKSVVAANVARSHS